MSARIFIDGEAGTTGLRIRELLEARADLSLVSLEANKRKDPTAKRELLGRVDVVVLCLPDSAARETAAMIDDMGGEAPRVLDASSAHRVDPQWTYGFPELCRDQAAAVAGARRVTNPGCYATGAIALLRPLVDAEVVPSEFPISINAVSGYSGGGRTMIEAFESGRAPAFELYGLDLEHKHLPEIERFSRLARRPLFVPSVGNFRQGMLVSVPLFLDELPGRPLTGDLVEILSEHYQGQPFVQVVDQAGGRLEPESLNGTNRLELCVYANPGRRQAVLVARLDNLGKGAAGAALQNLDLMLGVQKA